MKKNGFTLAEVLVVLGIIGVVAALTLPSLMSDTAASQIGPKLAKAVSMFDQANAGVLNDAIADHLADTGLLGTNGSGYVDKLTDHLKASSGGSISKAPSNASLVGSPAGSVTAKDGTIYQMYYNNNSASGGGAAHKDKIGYVVIDINGDANPNEPGTDIFAFTWWGDGSIRPAGGSNSDSGFDWKSQCKGKALSSDGSDEGVTDYWACAGHVFENNLKVKYE